MGSNRAIRPSLIKDRMPRIQKIVERSAAIRRRPTTEVETVLETCWIKRSKEMIPPRSSVGAFCVKRLFCIGEMTPLARCT